MERLKRILLIFIITISFSYSSTRVEVNVLEATETIRFLSQKITRNYLYLYANPKKSSVYNQIKRDISKMVDSIRTISMTTNDEYTKNILDFLIYSKDQIEDLVEKTPTKERSAMMLDYSEVLLEGADSIAKEYSYNFSENEEMLINSKGINYLLERTVKYYMALSIGLSSYVNKKHMLSSIDELQKKITIIDDYKKYPSELIQNRVRFMRGWKVIKNVFEKRGKLTLTNVIVLSTDEIEGVVRKFIIYHRKNQ